MAQAPAHVLVRLPNWLGDVLMARPALHALRRAWPQARVTACGPAPLLALLADDGVFDAGEPWPARPGALASLRAARPDVALVMPPSFSSAWFAWRTGARERVGYAHEARSPWLTRALPRPARGDLHASREYVALLAALLPESPPPLEPPPLPVAETAKAAARTRRGPAERPYAIVAPGAAYGPAKRWPLSRFVEVARALVGRGLDVLACGAAAEQADCEALCAAAGPGALALAGRTSLAEQAALCAGAEVVVSNDSGMAHLAGAVGAPTVAIFGSTSSAWTAPLGARVRVVQRAPVCAPCFARTCAIGYTCLTAIPAARVLRAVAEVRGESVKGAAS